MMRQVILRFDFVFPFKHMLRQEIGGLETLLCHPLVTFRGPKVAKPTHSTKLKTSNSSPRVPYCLNRPETASIRMIKLPKRRSVSKFALVLEISTLSHFAQQ